MEMKFNEKGELVQSEHAQVDMNKRSRFKSWGLWVSVLGAVGLILQASGLFEKIGIDLAKWDTIITALGSILVAFGIVNNPTDSKHI